MPSRSETLLNASEKLRKARRELLPCRALQRRPKGFCCGQALAAWWVIGKPLEYKSMGDFDWQGCLLVGTRITFPSSSLSFGRIEACEKRAPASRSAAEGSHTGSSGPRKARTRRG